MSKVAIVTGGARGIGRGCALALAQAGWSVALVIRGRAAELVLDGPWVPWMSVVICAELYDSAEPPGQDEVLVPRRGRVTPALCPSGRS